MRLVKTKTMSNCTSADKTAFYVAGRHDAIAQLVAMIVGLLAILAVFAACVAAFAPRNPRPATAPPAYKPAYEDPDNAMLMEPDETVPAAEA